VRRHPPESREPEQDMPLFASTPNAAAARARGHQAADAAAARAESIEPAWRTEAMEAVRLYAATHREPFIFEALDLHVPEEADRRAIGALATEAKRRGWVARAGYATDKWGSAKTCWRSLICGENGKGLARNGTPHPVGAEERSDELPDGIGRVNTQR
jgi:hypothetical protein